MKHLTIFVRPDASALAIGGQTSPRYGGNKATARNLADHPIIPASALRGALRYELERLLRGRDGEAAVCGVNEPETGDPLVPCSCPVCRLFGQAGGATGTLRLEDAVLTEEEASEATILRPTVAVSRRTGTVVARHLALLETSESFNLDGGGTVFRAAARLVPRGSQDSKETLAEDLMHLRAACASLQAIGGGKARGLGWVECSLEESAAAAATLADSSLPSTEALEFRFEALAPLHLGLGRPLAYFQPSLHHAPGSTVRGAVAFALLESGLSPEDARFQRLFGPGSRVSFGSARMEGDVPSAARRRCRPQGHVFDDLVGELIRRGAANSDVALAITERGSCPTPGCFSTKVLPIQLRRDALRPRLRVRTRTALNRLTGTAMDRKLYSIEALEPQAFRGEGDDVEEVPLVLTAVVRGLDAELCALLAGLHGKDVWLGGKRSRGMGRCRLSVFGKPAPNLRAVRDEVENLDKALRVAWRDLREAAGAALPAQLLPEDHLPLAIVLEEPWSPGGDAVEMGALLKGPFADAGLPLLDAFVFLSEEGRFGANEAERYGAPPEVLQGEQVPERAAAPGSTYVYQVKRDQFGAGIGDWVTLGALGTGLHPELGWGRFRIRGPETDF